MSKTEMKTLTINLPKKYIEAIETLTETREYPSRAEVIRLAVKESLPEDLDAYQNLTKERFSSLINNKREN